MSLEKHHLPSKKKKKKKSFTEEEKERIAPQMLTGFDGGYLQHNQKQRAFSPHTTGKLPRTEHPVHNAL